MAKGLKNKKAICITAFFISLFFFLLSRLGALARFENITYDMRMVALNENEPSGNVVLVFICDETLALLGEWPLSRDWHAGLTEILSFMGASAVVFDILFIDSAGEADYIFAESIKDAGNVVLPFFFQKRQRTDDATYFQRMVEPVELLSESARSAGFINILYDSDGIIRRYPLFMEHRGILYRSLGMAVMEDLVGARLLETGRGSITMEVGGEEKKVPLGDNYSSYMNIYRDLKKFPNYSFVQVLQSHLDFIRGEEPLIPPDAFAGKIVIVGFTATGASDSAPVPGVAVYPLMGMHASFIENFYSGGFIKKAGPVTSFFTPFVFSTLSGFAASVFPPALGATVVILLVAFFSLLATHLFSSYSIWLSFVPVVLSMVVVYGIIGISGFIFERREKLKIKNLFSRYISPQVMEKLIGSGECLSMRGEERTVTILFADIRGFTAFASSRPAGETFDFLNVVLGVMSDAVFRTGGMLDKFIGDEVMAIYGAPLEDAGHAEHAVLSAVRMMQDIEKLNKNVKLGIGINTGSIMIGNIGTEKRMEYTAIGNAVNMAAGIEEIAPPGEIMIGTDTYVMIKDGGIPCEHAGVFRVKGMDFALYRVLWKNMRREP